MSGKQKDIDRFGEAASIFIAFVIVALIVGSLAFSFASNFAIVPTFDETETERSMVFWTAVIACFTAMSAVISLLAVIILRATLVETQKAVRETADATSEMMRANKIAEGSRRDAIRPILKVSSEGPYLKERHLGLASATGEWPRTIPIHIFVKIQNIGATDAIIERIEFYFSEPAQDSENDVQDLNSKLHGAHLISKGSPIEVKFRTLIIDLAETVYWKIKSDPPYLVAKIYYRDVVFGVLREKSFSFRPSALWTREVKPYGSTDLNYDKEHSV